MGGRGQEYLSRLKEILHFQLLWVNYRPIWMYPGFLWRPICWTFPSVSINNERYDGITMEMISHIFEKAKHGYTLDLTTAHCHSESQNYGGSLKTWKRSSIPKKLQANFPTMHPLQVIGTYDPSTYSWNSWWSADGWPSWLYTRPLVLWVSNLT